MTTWLISANCNIYDHDGAFEKWGYIDWIQHVNYDVGDIVYIYATKQYARIRWVTAVIKTDMSYADKDEDDRFWVNGNDIAAPDHSSRYARLLLIKSIDDPRLSLDKLRMHGLKNAPQLGKRLEGELLDYINKCVGKINLSPSDSSVQQTLEEEMIKKFEEKVGHAGLQNSKLVCLSRYPDVSIKPDIFSQGHRIIGEVHAHLGKMKPAQKHKIANDILKMIAFEKDQGVDYYKYIVVCSDDEARYLNGDSYIGAIINMYGIRVVSVDLTDQQKAQLAHTIKRQDITRG